MSRPAYRPALASRNLSLGYGVLVAIACAPGLGLALWTSLLGLASIGIGLALGFRSWVSAGFGWFVIAAVVLDFGNGSIEIVLLVVLLAILAWDAGQRAIDVGAQLGRESETTRVELLHGGASAVVGVAATAVGYSIHSLASGARTFAVGALLLVVAAAITVWATR